MKLDLPRPSLGLVVVTQVLLGLLLFAGVVAVVLLPGFSSSIATSLPEYAELREPLLAVAMALTILGLIALAMVALLVHRIHAETVLARTSLLWVDVIINVLVLAIVLVVVGSVAIGKAQAGSPFLLLVIALTCLALAALAGIMLVLRSLLGGAIAMRAELDEVV